MLEVLGVFYPHNSKKEYIREYIYIYISVHKKSENFLKHS
jgi:hypothetical protein